MQNKIKSAFDSVHADKQLKKQTMDFIENKTHNKRSVLRPVCAAFACLALACFGGYKAYFTPTSIISIDINPSIELDVNRFDKVISVDSYNDDGEIFSNSLDIIFKDYNSAIDEILESDTIKNCLSENQTLSIGVLPLNEAQGENILQYVSNCTSGHENMHCYSLNQDEVSEAHSLGLSYGKYRVYLQLLDLGIEITPDEVNQMTMRELNDLIVSNSNTITTSNGNCNGNGNGNGNGNCNNNVNTTSNSGTGKQNGKQNGHHHNK